MTQRIQRKRTKGWRAPANTLNITRPGRHGNPFPILGGESWRESLLKFITYLDCMKRQHPEQYRNLISDVQKADYVMCWCPLDKPCHGDIWIHHAMKGLK